MTLYQAIRPLLFSLPPELAHSASMLALKTGVARPFTGPQPEISVLRCQVFGREFSNPLGIAAGYDKDAEVIAPLFGLGFGFVEVGGVTPLPQPGNPKPRVFRLRQDQSLINRFGLNSAGMDVVAKRLAAVKGRAGGVVGLNLGKNKDSVAAAADYAAVAALCGADVDFLTINVSSPNTPGLRALQSADALHEIIDAVRDALDGNEKTKVLVKIAPDLDAEDIKGIVECTAKLDGLVISNTTIDRPDRLRSAARDETGGLSGPPVFAKSTALLRQIYSLTEGKVPLIGVGGVDSASAAYAKIRAGASLVQLYTALVYHGPGLVNEILRGLLVHLEQDGFSDITSAVGADHQAE